jgi:DNA (cytosine-5)-methyltransferase 1
LFDIDILDGSPPCSSFSMAGSREDAWGESKKFREGQAEQVLDDLFFHFVKTATKLRPKVVVAENVKGLIMGNARGYVKEIFEAFRKAGYETQLFLLNASRMGVPQARERTFFVARRIDLKLPKLTLDFNEPVILVGMALDGVNRFGKKLNPGKIYNDWRQTPEGNGFGVVGGFNSQKKLSSKQVSFTQCATGRHLNWDQPCFLSDLAVQRLQSFPDDYNFLDQDAGYVCGMSVPPFMMQRVATDIAKQLF